MNADTFSKVASGVQSIAVVVGFAVGGWWALKTFIFQNPSYYEQGAEIVGRSPDVVKVDISIELLDKRRKQYEITLTVANASKTLRQILPPEDVELVYLEPGKGRPVRIPFQSSMSHDRAIEVPTSESRSLRFFVQFPSEGAYLLEANVCEKRANNCLAQKYVYVETANPLQGLPN